MLKPALLAAAFIISIHASAADQFEKIAQCGQDASLDEVQSEFADGFSRINYRVVVKNREAIEELDNLGLPSAGSNRKSSVVFADMNRIPDYGGTSELYRSGGTEVTYSPRDKEITVRRLGQAGELGSYTFKNCRRSR